MRPFDPARAVKRQHVEEDGIARLELPADDLVGGAIALDVRQILERSLREPLRLVVHERARHQPRAAVRAGDELERRRARDGIDREPNRACLRPVDVVVRLVLVPRRPLRRPRLLHEHVIVVEPHLLGTHQLTGDRRRRRVPGDPLELGQPLPVAEVLEEATRVVGTARDERALARLGEVGFDRRLGEREIRLRERSPHTDGAVAPERLDEGRRRRRATRPSRESTSMGAGR